MKLFLAKLIFLIAVLVFALSSCEKAQESSTTGTPVNEVLWEDMTEKYLPKTAEWTNRVEASDLNGDGRIDLIFANGGDYSEPGALESSRVFINKGPDAQFLEVTEDIFGDAKFYARVIKVRDLNGDGNPDILVGNTFQTQSELYFGLGEGKFKGPPGARPGPHPCPPARTSSPPPGHPGPCPGPA